MAQTPALASFIVQQLAFQVPTLLVYLLGMVVGTTYLSRHPRPAVLVVIASGLLFLTAVGIAVMQGYLIQARFGANLNAERSGQLMGIIGLLGNLARAGAFVLLLMAAFTGRDRPRSDPEFGGPSREKSW